MFRRLDPSYDSNVLPPEIALTIGSEVKNKDLWWARIMKHQRANYGDDYYDYINWEIESFLNKYPYFKPIFVEK